MIGIEWCVNINNWNWHCPECNYYNSDFVNPNELRYPECSNCNTVFDPDEFKEIDK